MEPGPHSFDIQKINDTVWIFKNAIKNSKHFIEYFEENKKWEDWPMFGKQAICYDFPGADFESFPTHTEWSQALKVAEDGHANLYFEDQINELFYQTTKLYAESNKLSLDNWSYKSWAVAKYNETSSDGHAMMHHTDYQREYAYDPGYKFGITAIFYLNDDYEGGEIAFKFLEDSDLSIVKEECVYKPNAGDIIVFTSGHPNYHAVNSVKNGQKYMLRIYWRYYYPGHPLWNRLREKYGSDVWKKMEEERVKISANKGNVHLFHNIPFWIPFEEYYKNEIEDLEK